MRIFEISNISNSLEVVLESSSLLILKSAFTHDPEFYRPFLYDLYCPPICFKGGKNKLNIYSF